jgi:hypothetical protein
MPRLPELGLMAKSERKQGRSWARFLEAYGAFIGLAVLIAIGCVISPDAFAKPMNVINILRQSSFIGIIAIGMTFVIILGGIDLSVGSMVALLGGLGIMAMNAAAGEAANPDAIQYGPILLAAAIMVIGGPLLGLANGALIAKGRVTPFIATLGAWPRFGLCRWRSRMGESTGRRCHRFRLAAARSEARPRLFADHAKAHPSAATTTRHDLLAVAVTAPPDPRKTNFGCTFKPSETTRRPPAMPRSRSIAYRILTYVPSPA